MSATQSFLSDAKYGYDFVVATTQESINATMDQYLSGIDAPEVIMCYIMDLQGNPQSIAYQDLITLAKGTDPFSVPDGTPTTDQRIINLSNAYFMYAFKAKIGLPAGYAPLTPSGPALPNIVTLGSDTSAVLFNLLCSEFQVTEATYGPRGIARLNQSQGSGDAWMFSSYVDLRLTPTADYGKLPTDVQNQVKNMGGSAFSVQQLLFDLANSRLETMPTISGVTPGTPLYNALQASFCGAYFAQMQAGGQPVLGYTIQQASSDPSTLVLTDFNFQVNPWMGGNGQPVAQPTVDQQNLSTLCYLCATNGDNLPVANEFSWNWVEASEAVSFNGIVSINRNTFARYFESQLLPIVQRSCYAPTVNVYLSGTFDTDVNYSFTMAPYQAPTVTMPTTGSTVVTMHYSNSASDEAGLGGDMGAMTLSPSMDASVVFSGNTIVVTQHLKIYLYVRGTFGVSDSGNVVDSTITDTYTLSVDSHGQLVARLVSNKTDDSNVPNVNAFSNFFGSDINKIMNDFAQWLKDFVGTSFNDIPLNTVQNFVFPGGNTFAFEDVIFSANQDLVSHITYVDPT